MFMSTTTKILAALLLTLTGFTMLADESKPYCTVELGKVFHAYTDLFDGASFRAAAGYKLTRNLGLEAAYENSPGGTDGDNFWRDIDGPTSFENVHMVSLLGTAEWNVDSRFSLFTKFGFARGKVDYEALDATASPNAGTLTETNVVVTLGVAVPVRDALDFTISVKEQMSANFFGLGDSFDSTTVGVGLRMHW